MFKKPTYFLLITIFFINSCIATKYLHRELSYQETFRSFFISKDLQDIVFMGRKYDYIFKDDEGVIENLIKLNWKKKLTIKNFDLTASGDNVKGNIIVETKAEDMDFTKEQLKILENIGFKKSEDRLVKTIMVNGLRYKPAPYSNENQEKSSFHNFYTTTIKEEISQKRKLARIAATPIAIAADGMIIYAGGIILPLMFIEANKNKNKKY